MVAVGSSYCDDSYILSAALGVTIMGMDQPPAPPTDPQPRGVARAMRVIRELKPVGLLAVVATLGPLLGWLLVLGTLHPLGHWLHDHVYAGLPLFALGGAVLSGLALLPTYAQSVLAGVAFGPVLGFTAVMAACAGAAAIAYPIAARIAGDHLVNFIDAKPKWRQLRLALLGAGFWRSLLIVTLVRLVPNATFELTNVLMASVRVPFAAYLVGTMLGMAPRVYIAVAFVARSKDQLGMLREGNTYALWHMVDSAAIALVVLTIIALIARHALKQVTSGDTQDSSPGRSA
jgi:uncharacterized membrane protein YdjX (TVP38/TMEM64 family)